MLFSAQGPSASPSSTSLVEYSGRPMLRASPTHNRGPVKSGCQSRFEEGSLTVEATRP
jgi:hypothetical protein